MKATSPLPKVAPPSSISAEAAVRLIKSSAASCAVVVIDARSKGLFALERVRGAIHPPTTSTCVFERHCETACTFLVYDSGTLSLNGAVTKGTEQVDLLCNILLKNCLTNKQESISSPSPSSLSSSPTSVINATTTTLIRKNIFLISGGLPSIRLIAPYLIQQNTCNLFETLSNNNNIKTSAQITKYAWARKALRSSIIEMEPPARILPNLYVGSAHHALDSKWLKKHDITHILSAGDEFIHIIDEPSNSITNWCRLSIRDTIDEDLRQHFHKTITFLNNARTQRGISIVHCVAGASRSIALVIAYFVFHGWSVNDAITHIRILRPAANPNIGFLKQLNQWEIECKHRTIFGTLSINGNISNNNNNNNNNNNQDTIRCNDSSGNSSTTNLVPFNGGESISAIQISDVVPVTTKLQKQNCFMTSKFCYEIPSPRRLTEVTFGDGDSEYESDDCLQQLGLNSR